MANTMRASTRFKERLLDFAFGLVTSVVIGYAPLFIKLDRLETRVSNVETKMESVTTITIKPGVIP